LDPKVFREGDRLFIAGYQFPDNMTVVQYGVAGHLQFRKDGNMSIRAWSKDYISGLTEIDAHHETLFGMINAFHDKNDENAPDAVVLEFLDALLQYCGYHFGREEELMKEFKYPLTEFHINVHRDLTNTVKKIINQLKKGEIKDPYITVISFATDWLNNHIAHDDLTFLSFYKNSDYDLSENFLAKQCMISRFSDNEILGTGRIGLIRKNEVFIKLSSDIQLPLKLNDSVKVTTSSSLDSTQMFIAKTFFSGHGDLKLFNATIVMTLNRRQHLRVTSDIEAKLWIGDESHPAKIVNIGAGGIMLNTYQLLKPSQTAIVEFVVENNRFKEVCEERSTIRKIGAANSYGMQFVKMGNDQFDRLTNYVFNRQTLIRKNRGK